MMENRAVGGRYFSRFRSLDSEGTRDIGGTLEQMAKSLESAGLEGTVQLRILDGPDWKVFSIKMTKRSSHLVLKAVESPDLEVITRSETWLDIAAGKLSPLEAFVTGQMRVRGNHRLGVGVIQRLAEPGGRSYIC